MDLNLLKTIRAVNQYGSLAAAARRLGYTPSAVSQQMAKLQSDLQSPLTRLRGRTVTLTEAGQRVAEAADAILEQWESLESDLQALSGSFPSGIRIAAFSTAARGLLPRVLSKLAETAADLKVDVVEERSHIATELLERGDADLCIAHDWYNIPLQVPNSVSAELIGVDQVDVVVPVDHPLTSQSEVRVSDLYDAVWAIEPGSVALDLLNHLFATVNATPTIVYHLREYATQLRFIEEHLAIGLIPRLGRERLPPSLTALPTAPPAVRRIYALTRRSVKKRPVIQLLLSTIHAEYNALAADAR